METKLYVLEFLLRSRARTIDAEALEKMETSELEFTVSPNDFLYNIIEARRAKQSIELGQFGRPFRRDAKIDLVSVLDSRRF